MDTFHCIQCARTFTVTAEAEAVCAYLTERLGPDPLRVRWWLCRRGALQRLREERPRCAFCRGCGRLGFDSSVERGLGPHWGQQLDDWFGPGLRQ